MDVAVAVELCALLLKRSRFLLDWRELRDVLYAWLWFPAEWDVASRKERADLLAWYDSHVGEQPASLVGARDWSHADT